MTTPAPFTIADADVPALRQTMARLADIGYSESKVRDRLGLADLNDLHWRASPIYRAERLAPRDPLALAIDLFLLQGSLSAGELEILFGNGRWEVLGRSGILAVGEDGRVRARASLYPVGNHLLFSDPAWPKLPHPGWTTVAQDQVMFIGTDSRWLARGTIRQRVENALDLCTGSGIHALLAASHAKQVLAVDINPRAAQCTRFNALAAGTGNVDVAVGDLFQPAQGRCFDLITANPPFVPSPMNSLGFRDGGASGEEVQRRIIAGLPQYLARGGIAQIITELGERDDDLLEDRLRAWLGGAPMDIYVLRLRTTSAASYAIGHAQGDDDYGEFLDSVDQWSGNLKAQGYSRMVSLLLAFQWSDSNLGPSWTCRQEAPPPSRDAGYEIKALLTAQRLSRQPYLESLLAHGVVSRTGPIGLIESRMLGGALAGKTQATLLGKALSIRHWLDPIERELLGRIDGPVSWADLLALGRKLELNHDRTLAAVRSLLARGLVVLSPSAVRPSPPPDAPKATGKAG
jgi:hypothetical protein